MADGIYVGMHAAVARMEQLEAIADNLANAQTPGFKSARPVFQLVAPAPASDKAFTVVVGAGIDMRPGAVAQTGNPLDLIPEGNDLFFAVQTAEGGTAFTRGGRIAVEDGRLCVGSRALLDNAGRPIPVPPGAIPVIDRDGRVRAGDLELGRVGLFRLTGPIERLGPSLLAARGGSEPVQGGVRPGVLELGNSSPLEAAVQLVSVQRHFEAAMQAIQTYRRLDERASEIVRIR